MRRLGPATITEVKFRDFERILVYGTPPHTVHDVVEIDFFLRALGGTDVVQDDTCTNVVNAKHHVSFYFKRVDPLHQIQ